MAHQKERRPKAMMLGLGLDETGGHVRITRGPNFTVLLGSEVTHERLSVTCIRVNEQLKRRGRRLEHISAEEFADLVREAAET